MSVLDRQGEVEAWATIRPNPAHALAASGDTKPVVVARRTQPAEWLPAAEERVHALRSLESDWDSYGAMPVHSASIRRALDLVHELAMIQNVAAPTVTASNDGHAALCWDAGTWSLDVEVLPDGTIDYTYLDRRDESRSQEEQGAERGTIARLLTQWSS